MVHLAPQPPPPLTLWISLRLPDAKFSPVPPRLRVVLLILSVEEKKQRRVVFFWLASAFCPSEV